MYIVGQREWKLPVDCQPEPLADNYSLIHFKTDKFKDSFLTDYKKSFQTRNR